MSVYSQTKALWHIDRIAALRRGNSPVPVHLQLILSDLCNQDCSFCAYRMSGGLSTELFKTAETHNPNRRMEFDKAQEIIRDAAAIGYKAIQFTGGGEPTVHPQHLNLIDQAQHLGLRTALVTNGIKLEPGADPIQRLDWLRISVDAGTEDVYCDSRGVTSAHWRKLWTNIEAMQGFEGNFGLGFVVTNENYRTLNALCDRALRLDVPYIRVGAVFSEMGIGYYRNIAEICEQIDLAKRTYADTSLQIIDMFGHRLSDLENGSPEHAFCGYQHFTRYIGADLNVYRCCNTAYTPLGLLGSLKNERLRDFHPKMEFDARQCRYCQFIGQNQAIDTLLSQPKDVDFV